MRLPKGTKMSILVDENTRVVVQGITGRDGSFHAKAMKDYGTKVVAGVTPGKGGQQVEGIPVFNTVAEAVERTGANTSCIFVPAFAGYDAILEAAEAGVKLVVAVTEGIPSGDMEKAVRFLDERGTKLIGPNCPGIISPGKAKVGILPGRIFAPGPVGLVSRSGTLTYEVVSHLTDQGLGQTTAIGMGGDPIIGLRFTDYLEMFAADPDTEAMVVIGEIGGTDEQDAARFIKEKFGKPVVAFIAGRTAPAEKRMGHAGAIISGSEGTAEEKIKAFADAGVPTAALPEEVPLLLKERMKATGS